MKKLFAAVFVLSLVVAPTVTSASFFDLFKTDRAYQGAQVKASTGDKLILQVQQSLTAQGFYKGEMSGVVGSKTKTAIKSFQKMNKLPVTGLLDKATVDAILKSGGGSANVSYPSRVCNQNTGPWIKVLSPNGGEVFTAGQQIDITWSTCSIDNPVQILLMKINPDLDFQPNGTITSLVGNTTANDGNETVTLPTFGLNGDEDFWYSGQQEYRVMITELGDGGPGVFLPKDFSNENFTINAGGTEQGNGIGENCPNYGPLLIATMDDGQPTAVSTNQNQAPSEQVITRLWLYPVCDLTLYNTTIENNGNPSIVNSTPWTPVTSVFSNYHVYAGDFINTSVLLGETPAVLGGVTIQHSTPLQLYANQPQQITLTVDVIPGATGTAQTCFFGFNVIPNVASPLANEWSQYFNNTNKLLGRAICQNKVSIVN